MKENLRKTKALLLDLDGTVYIDGALIGDVQNTLEYFRRKGVRLVYLTNNSSRTSKEYVKRLKKIGIFDERDIVYSSLDSAVDYILDNYADKTVYPVATKSVVKGIKKSGIKITETRADIVLLTFDRELDYKKIVKANELMVKGATYIATHPDLVCPAPDVNIPDLGSFIKAFESSSGRLPDVITGKPYKILADYIMKRLNLAPEQVTMVGDRLYTDIAFGVNSKINTVLVLSGETTAEQAETSSVKADITLNNIDELKKYI